MSITDTAYEVWTAAQGPQAIEDSIAAIEQILRKKLESSPTMTAVKDMIQAQAVQENAALAVQNQQLREALENHQGNYKLTKSEAAVVEAALALPDILRKHDAETLRKEALHAR